MITDKKIKIKKSFWSKTTRGILNSSKKLTIKKNSLVFVYSMIWSKVKKLRKKKKIEKGNKLSYNKF